MTTTLTSLAIPALAASSTLLAWSVLALRWTAATSRGHTERKAMARRAPPRAMAPFAAGLSIAGVMWIALDLPLLASATLLLWVAGLRILRTRHARQCDASDFEYALEAIGSAGRALRAGIPMTGVLRILADESRGSAQTAFREIVGREALGEELATSISSVLLKSPNPALRAFGLAMIQQLAAGGNLAEVTDRLARALVDRARIRRRARAILAYGRAATIALALVPLLIVPMLCQIVDGYADLLLRSNTGHVLLIVSASLLVMGVVSIQRLTDIDAMRPESRP